MWHERGRQCGAEQLTEITASPAQRSTAPKRSLQVQVQQGVQVRGKQAAAARPVELLDQRARQAGARPHFGPLAQLVHL